MENPYAKYAQPTKAAPPSFIAGTPDPYKAEDQQIQRDNATRAAQDQALQQQQFQLNQQKAAIDIEKGKRDLVPGADTTESEKTAGFLTTRVAAGINELNRITGKDPSAKSPTFGVEAVRSIFGDTAANYFTDADRQQVVAAQTDILDAALTLGTGAAYTAEQLKGYRQSYFPQLGDDDATVTAKQQRLVQLLESAKVKAGRSAPMIEQALAAVSGGTNTATTKSVSAELKTKNDALNSAWMSGEIRTLEELYARAESLGLDISKTDRQSLALQIKSGNRGSFAPNPDTDGPSGGGSGGGDLGTAFAAGVGDIVEGAGDLVGLVSNPLNAGINAIAGTNLSTDLGASARAATGLPRGNPVAEAINKGGIGALAPAGLANALMRGGTNMGRSVVTNALAQQPIQQGVGGAGAGLAAEAVNQAGGGPILQAGAALAGGLGSFSVANRVAQRGAAPVVNALAPTGPGTSTKASQNLVPNAAQIARDGDAAGLRVMTSDIRPPTTRIGKLTRTMGENIPLAGTGGQRAKQQTERGDVVRNLMKDFGADEASIDAVSADLIKTRGAMIGKLTDAKKSVIEGIKGSVPAPKAIAEIDKQIAELKGIDGKAYKPVIERLQDFKTALQSGKTLKQVEGQRRLLGDLFADTSLAGIKTDGQKAINAIYDPLRKDMGDFIGATAGPEARSKWAGANERLSAMMGELDASAFKGLLNKAETTPESAAKIIFGKTPSDMRRLYGSLSDKGKAKAQSAILFQAAEKSTTNDVISPQKFATAMEAMSKSTGVFFSPADKARIDGMTRLIKATQQASEAGASPMTGAQNTPFIAGISLAQVFGTAALPATAAAGLLARVYESKPVRDAFLRLGQTKAGTPQEKRAVQGVISSIAAANDNGGKFMANMPSSPAAAAAQTDDVND